MKWNECGSKLKSCEKCWSSYWDFWRLIADFGILANLSTFWHVIQTCSETLEITQEKNIWEAGEYSAKLLNLVLLLSRRKILKQYFCAFPVFFPHPCSVSLFPLSSCAFLFSPASVFQTCWSINSLFTISKMHLNIWIWWMSPKAVHLLHEPTFWTETRGLWGLLLV